VGQSSKGFKITDVEICAIAATAEAEAEAEASEGAGASGGI